MITSKDNDGKPTGFIETLVSNKEVVTVNATPSVTVVTARDRETGKVTTEIFYGKNPLVNR